MDITPPSSMQRFMIRVGLGKKRKVQRQSSHIRSPSRPRNGLVKGRPISTYTTKESVKSARDVRRSTSKYVASESDPSSLGALPNSSSNVLAGQNLTRPPQPMRAKTFFGTLTNKLRVRKPASRHTTESILTESKRSVVQSSLHRRTSRAQAVAIALPNDIASRERRAEALRSRGLLPSRTLSAIEAEEDRRIDTLKVNDLSFSGPDRAHSDAKEIVQSWRSGNSMWLSLSPTMLDAPVNSVPEVISPIEMSDDGLELSAEVVLPTSGPRDEPASVPKLLPSDARLSPVPSPAESDGKQEARPSRPASLRQPSPEGLTGLVTQSVPASPRSENNLPLGNPQTEIVGDAEKHPSAPSLSTSSEGSFLQQSPITEEPQFLLTTSSSQRSVSPSRESDGVPTPRSPRLPPSPRSVRTPRPAPTGPLPDPPDLSASPQTSVSDGSPLRLRPSEFDILPASPTSPTVPSLFCSSSSEISHNTVLTDNGETLASLASFTMPIKGRRANLPPIMVKSSEGLLCEEIIIETTESFPEDDVDPFAGPSNTSPVNLKVDDVSAAHSPRRKSFTLLGRGKNRAATLDPSPASPTSPTSLNFLTAGISKSASMANLRRSMTSVLQAARPRSTFSPVDVQPRSPRSPTLSPLNVTMHNGASIHAQASLIDDDETRRLSELAFM